MSNYKRTALGEKELLARALKLNARTRTLLLLLESDDLKQLNISAREKIANPENYQILLDLGLISQEGNTVPIQIEPVNSIQVKQHVVEPIAQPVVTEAKQESISVDATTIIAPIYASVSDQEESQKNSPENHSVIKEEVVEIQNMDFMQVKELMQQTLKQYCGLMAKNLVIAIGQSDSVQEMRQHQSKWLTSLFETRISRQQLNELLNTINHNMDRIEFMNG